MGKLKQAAQALSVVVYMIALYAYLFGFIGSAVAVIISIPGMVVMAHMSWTRRF